MDKEVELKTEVKKIVVVVKMLPMCDLDEENCEWEDASIVV